jgi:hypothetical protein
MPIAAVSDPNCRVQTTLNKNAVVASKDLLRKTGPDRYLLLGGMPLCQERNHLGSNVGHVGQHGRSSWGVLSRETYARHLLVASLDKNPRLPGLFLL